MSDIILNCKSDYIREHCRQWNWIVERLIEMRDSGEKLTANIGDLKAAYWIRNPELPEDIIWYHCGCFLCAYDNNLNAFHNGDCSNCLSKVKGSKKDYRLCLGGLYAEFIEKSSFGQWDAAIEYAEAIRDIEMDI